VKHLPVSKALKKAFDELGRKPPHVMTAIRWIRKGKFGVRLDATRFNGRYETTVEAIHAFLAAVEKASGPSDRRAEARLRQLADAELRLSKLLE